MKKVILCIPSLETGGAEKFVVDLATQMNRTEFEPVVAITRVNSDTQFKKTLKEHDIRVVDLSGRNYLEMLSKQLTFLKQERPDVIHANTGSILHMMLATKIVSVPVKLYTVHNQAEYLYGNNRVKKYAYIASFSCFGYVPVAICDNVKQSIMKVLRIPEKQIRQVNNGVDLKNYTSTKKCEESKLIRIVNTGRMTSVKRQEEVVKLFSRLCKRYHNIRLTILGDGELRAELERVAEKNGVSKMIDMLGNQKDVCSHLQAADIYVSASSTEGLPLSILEAMACGLPIVATDAGGTVDIVKNGENGIVVSKYDMDALEKALEQMILNPELRDRCGKESLRIVQEWSLERCVRGYEQLYDSCK